MFGGHIEFVDDLQMENIKNGITMKIYTSNSKNSPTDYGVVLYIAYTEEGNSWITAIAFATGGDGIWFSSKTNESAWRGWKEISTVK